MSTVALLVLDEIQMIGRPGRGPRLEMLLMRFRRSYPDVHLLGLAAVGSGLDRFAEWLGAIPIVYQGDRVVVNGQPAATAQEYYAQALALAAAGGNAPPAGGDWQPLGVFAAARPGETRLTEVLQLAVNGQGLVGGNVTDVANNTVRPLRGAVDRRTQRAAWTVGTDTTTVYEAGIGNLTQEQAPCLVHAGPDRREERLLVRLPPPAESRPPPAR